ncbi:UvrD-helicase domain-containing protein [Salinifilum ghardaiensis]
MRFYADLHIHAKYARACSKDGTLPNLAWWARRKGVALLGTGDITHPAWFAHAQEMLTPAEEPGLYRLRDDVDAEVLATLPESCRGTVRFALSVEISTIYKAGGHTRKVHHLCYLPDFAAAERFIARLSTIGNLASDGRPILGLDSRDLLEITLESGDGAYLVPAHIWTPWFAALGSKAGFDSLDECYRDLAGHVFAVETGLSSDPEMNWRVSGLDRYTLVSYSDAHSPPMVAREATAFDVELDYFAVKSALETGRGYAGTVEFFPEEGKYHLDGHRGCGLRCAPEDTAAHGGVCPDCGKALTVGVLNRVAAVADRPAGARPQGAVDYRNRIPLPEIIGELRGVGPKSKTVFAETSRVTAAFGPELHVLDEVPVEQLAGHDPALGEAIRRLRAGRVRREAGFDGQYGVIRLFDPGEAAEWGGSALALFDAPTPTVPARRAADAPGGAAAPAGAGEHADAATGGREAAEEPPGQAAPARPGVAVGAEQTGDGTEPPEPDAVAATGLLAGLDGAQAAAAACAGGPLLIVAGPGTGKTRTVTHRLAHLVAERGADPRTCLAVTFTRRAAAEMRQRLEGLLGAPAAEMTVTTFHGLALRILREHADAAGLTAGFGIADAAVQHDLRLALAGDQGGARRLADAAGRVRLGEPVEEDVAALVRRYHQALAERDLVDFDGLLDAAVAVLAEHPQAAAAWRDRFAWITVDEYQDVDAVQYRLLRQLAPPEGNVTAIGDPDQAIYAFRGADVGYFLRFTADFPTARVCHLQRNYRSGAHILTAAQRAVAASTFVPDRVLAAAGDRPAHRIVRHTAADEHAEAAYIAGTVEQLLGGASFHALDAGRASGHERGGFGFGDVAVLYRTEAQAHALAEALDRQGLPVQRRSHERLAQRTGVRLVTDELARAGGGAADDVVTGMRRAAEVVAGRVPDETAAQVHHAVDLLLPLARRCRDVTELAREVALGAEVDVLDPRAEAVCLLTLHAAKGLEFPVVFLAGCEDGLLPLSWPQSPPDEQALAEERRLVFVGMTRAHERLYLTGAARRGGRDRRRSPLLDGLGDAVVDAQPVRRQPRPRQLSLL